MKFIPIFLAGMLSLSLFSNSLASAAESTTPKVVGTTNGFTFYEDGFATLNGDEYDPRDPNAAAMLDYLEQIGEIETIEEPLLYPVDDGCAAKIYARVDKSEQNMYVHLNCSPTPTYVWRTSTGLTGPTPTYNTYASGRLGTRTNESSRYRGGCNIRNASGGYDWHGNMSYAVYLAANGNYAIHGGCEEELLGQPRSHGCIRIARANAQLFRGMVAEVIANYGREAVRIQITN